MIEVMGYIDDQHRLTGNVPLSIDPGPIRIQLLVDGIGTPETDPADAGWQSAVAKDWEAYWSDPREDIYTIHDGTPVDDSR